MTGWREWLLLGLVVWAALSLAVVAGLARWFRLLARSERRTSRAPATAARRRRAETVAADRDQTRVLVVDDDPAFRALLLATLAGEAAELAEAGTAAEARAARDAFDPHLVVLDVSLPDASGLVFCAELREDDDGPKVVLLTGTEISEEDARLAGAETVLRKPFSPLALLEVIERLGTETALTTPLLAPGGTPVEGAEQLTLYARDLARVIEIERAQRRLIESAYRHTVSALASTLEARDTGTNLHSLRVTRYALELAGHASPELLDDPSVVYGFLLHDIGKIGVPDRILLKPGPLDPSEWTLMRRHPELGEEILGEVAILHGEGLRIVRSHHERWDGSGYPDGLAGSAISPGARIFAVADALDAMTSDRPYRPARTWKEATEEIEREAGRQFDPRVVETLLRQEGGFRSIHHEMAEVA